MPYPTNVYYPLLLQTATKHPVTPYHYRYYYYYYYYYCYCYCYSYYSYYLTRPTTTCFFCYC